MTFHIRFVLFIGALLLIINYVSCWPDTDSSTLSDTPVTQRPSTIYFKNSLEQLKKMEESALKGWYDMVQKFLALIKPDDEILGIIIDYFQGTSEFEFPSSAIELAKKNAAFLTLVSLGLSYCIIMFLSGLFFLCCRCVCQKCGAKPSQHQMKHMNFWRTTHKFCLVFMIAFLIVPIVSIIIINQHMKRSFPSIKSNISDIFPVISKFANRTESDVNDIAKVKFQDILDKVQDKENFKKGFAVPLQEDIFSSVNSESLVNIKVIVSWILNVQDNFVPKIEESMVNMKRHFQNLQGTIASLRTESTTFQSHCRSTVAVSACELAIKDLSIERLNVNGIEGEVTSVLDKLKEVDSNELRNLAEKIQDNTLLSDKIMEKSDNLKNFASEFKPKQGEILAKIKTQVKKFADVVRNFASRSQEQVDIYLSKSDFYEYYRWWVMFGIGIVLVIPVFFLILGLMCGCCGYRKDCHPSKRSSISHCGGLCLILAVYYIFIFASILMLLTVALFIVGGNAQSLVCAPLYQNDFEILNEVKTKLEVSYHSTTLSDVHLSKFLNNCKEDKSVFEAIDMHVLNKSSSEIIKKELEKNLRSDEIELNLKNSIESENKRIQDKFRGFSNKLDVRQMRDFPKQLSLALDEVRTKIDQTKQNIDNALSQSMNSNPDIERDLQAIEKTAATLIKTLNSFKEELNSFAFMVSTTYDNATSYMQKVNLIIKDLENVNDKLMGIVRERLFQYIVNVVNADLYEAFHAVGQCEDLWIVFDTARTVVCDFIVYPVNGFWFSLGWALVFIIPTIIFAIKLSRHYLRLKTKTASYRMDEREVALLDDMSRGKPFSYTSGSAWMPQQNYMVHPTSSNHIRQFDYK